MVSWVVCKVNRLTKKPEHGASASPICGRKPKTLHVHKYCTYHCITQVWYVWPWLLPQALNRPNLKPQSLCTLQTPNPSPYSRHCQGSPALRCSSGGRPRGDCRNRVLRGFRFLGPHKVRFTWSPYNPGCLGQNRG